MSERFRFKHLRQADLAGDVESQSGEATLGELRGLLHARKLTPDDLVDFGRGWETISDTPELGAIAERLPQRRDPLTRWLLGLFGAALAVFLAGYLLHSGDLMALGQIFLYVVPWVLIIALGISKLRGRPDVSERPFDPDRKD